MQLKIEYLPLEALTPYERNARKHEAADIETIKNSIKEFGMCDPIGIWGDKNIIVEGHGRLLALKELGQTQAPCIRLDHLTELITTFFNNFDYCKEMFLFGADYFADWFFKCQKCGATISFDNDECNAEPNKAKGYFERRAHND